MINFLSSRARGQRTLILFRIGKSDPRVTKIVRLNDLTRWRKIDYGNYPPFESHTSQEISAGSRSSCCLLLFAKAAISRPSLFWVLQMEMADRLLNVENDLARFHSYPKYTPQNTTATGTWRTAPQKRQKWALVLDLSIPPIDIWHMVRLGTNLLSMKKSLQKFHVLMASGLLSFAAARRISFARQKEVVS